MLSKLNAIIFYLILDQRNTCVFWLFCNIFYIVRERHMHTCSENVVIKILIFLVTHAYSVCYCTFYMSAMKSFREVRREKKNNWSTFYWAREYDLTTLYFAHNKNDKLCTIWSRKNSRFIHLMAIISNRRKSFLSLFSFCFLIVDV